MPKFVHLKSIPLTLVLLTVVVLQSVLFVRTMHAVTGGRWVLPLDDAYIHQQYARQAATGYPFRYNIEDPPTSGSTSLLYPFLLVIPWLLGLRGDALSVVSFFIGACALLWSVMLSRQIAQKLGTRWVPLASVPVAGVELLAPLLLVSNGALLWGFFSGMETGLYVALFLATLNAHISEDARGVALWGGLLVLMRPEGQVTAAVIIVVAMLRAFRNRGNDRAHWSWLYIVPFVCGLVQPALNMWLTGSLSANGMRAKSWLYNHPFEPFDIVRQISKTFLNLCRTFILGIKWDQQPWGVEAQGAIQGLDENLWYLPPLLGLSALVYLIALALHEWRGKRVSMAASFLLIVVAGLATNATMMTAEWHYYRYALPFLALTLIVGASAIGRAGVVLGRGRSRTAYLALAGLALILSIITVPGFLWRYGEAIRTMVNQQIRLAEWINTNLPPGAWVGVHDCGAIRYYGGHPTYDLVGLTAPKEVSASWRQGSGHTFETMEQAQHLPAFFAIYDDAWTLPYLAKTSLFGREIYRVEHVDKGGVTAASDHQAIYVADWTLRNSGDRLCQSNILDIVKGLELVDALDIADLRSEREHNYRYWPAPGKHTGPSELYQLTYSMPPHQAVLDGGRMLTGGESFDLRTHPGKDLVLIGRFMGTNEVALQVMANGTAVGQLHYPAFAGAWQERALLIPGTLITGAKTRIEIYVDNNRPGFIWHRPFYYWAFQGNLAAYTPKIAHRLDSTAGDTIRLLGYDLVLKETGSSSRLEVTLYWRAEQPVQKDLKVFVHWVDDQDRILAQRDSRPQEEGQPTWMWQPGFIVQDTYRLDLPLAEPPYPSTIYVGFYDAKTMDKFPLSGADAAGRFLLARLTLP